MSCRWRKVCASTPTGDSGVSATTDDARLLLRGGAPARAVQDLLERRHGMSRREAYALVLRLRDG